MNVRSEAWHYLLWVLHFAPSLLTGSCNTLLFLFSSKCLFWFKPRLTSESSYFDANRRLGMFSTFWSMCLQSWPALASVQYHQRASAASGTAVKSGRHGVCLHHSSLACKMNYRWSADSHLTENSVSSKMTLKQSCMIFVSINMTCVPLIWRNTRGVRKHSSYIIHAREMLNLTCTQEINQSQ